MTEANMGISDIKEVGVPVPVDPLTREPGPERDREMAEMMLAGIPGTEIARMYGISKQAVSIILRRLRKQIDFDPSAVMRDIVVDTQYMRDELMEIIDTPPPPAFTKDGVILRDERDEVVRDQAGRMAAMSELRMQLRGLSTLLGLDAPKRVELTERRVRHIIDGELLEEI